jgi:hypothetical protein
METTSLCRLVFVLGLLLQGGSPAALMMVDLP